MHKWIGTYNLYYTILTRFFKWLYNPDLSPKARPRPPVIENIYRLKRKEISIYRPTDLWTEDDDSLFFKYCPSKRMLCYHAISRDSSCRPHELLKLKIKDVVFKLTDDKKQYAEVLVNGKTGCRHIPLINSIPYVKDYLDHEHPQPGNLNAPLICGLGKSLGSVMLSVTTGGNIPRFPDSYIQSVLVFGYAWVNNGQGLVAAIHLSFKDSFQNPSACHTHTVVLSGGTSTSTACIQQLGTSQAGITIMSNALGVNTGTAQAGSSIPNVSASFIVQKDPGCTATGLGVQVLSSVAVTH